MTNPPPSYRGYRFPPEIISHAVWLFRLGCPLLKATLHRLLRARSFRVAHCVRQPHPPGARPPLDGSHRGNGDTHDEHLARLTTETSLTLREGFGVGAHTAAELLILFGDTPLTGFVRTPPSRSAAARARSRPRPGGPPAGTADGRRRWCTNTARRFEAADPTERMQPRVHPQYKTKYRVKHWASYDRALVRRGDITIW